MKKLFALGLFSLLILASIPLIAGSSADKGTDNIAYVELIDVPTSVGETARPSTQTRLRCSWVCEDGSTGTCYPPDAETCLQEADAACGDTESD